jgi:hypothetical protein
MKHTHQNGQNEEEKTGVSHLVRIWDKWGVHTLLVVAEIVQPLGKVIAIKTYI